MQVVALTDLNSIKKSILEVPCQFIISAGKYCFFWSLIIDDYFDGREEVERIIKKLQIVMDDSIDSNLIMQTLLLVLRLMFMELQKYHASDNF